MNLQPRYTASATLTGLKTGPLTIGAIAAGLQAQLAPFLKGDRGEQGEKGDTGDVSTAAINGGFF